MVFQIVVRYVRGRGKRGFKGKIGKKRETEGASLFLGFCGLIFIILLIFGPMLMFSSYNNT
jgi:hypothetical protein